MDKYATPMFFGDLERLIVNGHTDGQTYGHTNTWMDKPSYRDARTHLKTRVKTNILLGNEGICHLAKDFSAFCQFFLYDPLHSEAKNRVRTGLDVARLDGSRSGTS